MERRGRFATTGTFDGVHLGHRLLLDTLVRRAAETGLIPTAFILETHPLALIAPHRMPPQLSLFSERAALAADAGVEVVPLRFGEETRSLTSAGFIDKIADEFGVKGILIGHDNKIGSDRSSGFEDYRAHGERRGIIVEEAPVLPGISSSAVRKTLLAGDVRRAASMLGRPYRLPGTVAHGEHLGTRLGFPTANLEPLSPSLLVPGGGVYATMICVEGYASPFPAVTNIGTRPTVSSGEPARSIETYISGFSADIYGRRVSLDFIDRIRDERRFASLDELVARMRVDTDEALRLLTNNDNTAIQSDIWK